MSDGQNIGIYYAYHSANDASRAELVMSHSASSKLDVPSIWTREAWEDALAQGNEHAESLIEDALAGISVTCLLIGEETAEIPWIRKVLKMSHKMGKGVFAVYIHTIPDLDGKFCKKGPNPMGNLKYTGRSGLEYPYSSYYFSYDWKLHNGPERFNYWAEIAGKQVTDPKW